MLTSDFNPHTLSLGPGILSQERGACRLMSGTESVCGGTQKHSIIFCDMHVAQGMRLSPTISLQPIICLGILKKCASGTCFLSRAHFWKLTGPLTHCAGIVSFGYALIVIEEEQKYSSAY